MEIGTLVKWFEYYSASEDCPFDAVYGVSYLQFMT